MAVKLREKNMFKKIQILTIFIIFNNNFAFASSLSWPDITDINSIHDFFEKLNYKIDNEYKIISFMDESEKSYEVKNFAIEILRIFNNFEQTDKYKSNFSWQEFDKKLKDYRINKKNILSLLPHVILKDIKHQLYIVDSSINRLFNYKISNNINDIENLCSFSLNHSVPQTKLTYYYLKNMFISLTDEINYREAKSESIRDVDCNQHLFLQDLYNLSKEIIRGFVLKFIRSSVAMSLKAKCTDLNVEKKLINERNDFMKNLTEFMNFTRNYLDNYSGYFYACDFSNHTRGETYIELERMFQVIIENEYYLDKEGSCGFNCDTKHQEFTEKVNFECMDLDCKYMGEQFKVCQLYDDVRRYQWFRDENNTAYGNNYNTCSGNLTTYASWYHWTTRYCDYCVCICTAKPHRKVHNHVTAISFQDRVSDTDSNKVIVDLKFLNKNNTIYVDIKQGKLLPDGKIDDNSLSWKAFDDCTIFDEFTACRYPPQPNSALYDQIKASKDFGYPKAFNLDDLKASTSESVVTGVRFRFAGDLNTYPKLKNGSIELQIRLTDFDYKTGKLSKSHAWISSTSQNIRRELLLQRPDNPIKSPKNVPNLEKNQFVKFKISDIKKDAGQSTVPFFDARPVKTKVLFPLKGIGLFHRGYKGFGGFIAFKLFIISPHEYMNPNLGVVKSNKSPLSNLFNWDSFSSFKWFP